MTPHALELDLVLPQEAECADCVGEVGRELARVAGICSVAADVPRGLLEVQFDEAMLAVGDVETFARRAGAQAHCSAHCPVALHDHERLDLTVPLPGEDDLERRVLHVLGMDCADCATKLETAVLREPGVAAADVSFGAATLAIAFDPRQASAESVAAAVRRLGYDTVERPGELRAANSAPTRGRGFWLRDRRARLTLLSGVLVAAGFAAQAWASTLAPALFLLAVLAGGLYVVRAAFFSLRARQVDMNVLMTLAAAGAVAIGAWSEAALVVFLFGLGTALQAATMERTRRAIGGLMDLTPPTVTVLREGVEVVTPVAEVACGDEVLVRPGQRLAVDGVVLEGRAGANQAPITGEAAPVPKGPGDSVLAGSIVEKGSLRVRVTAGAGDNTVARIVHLVEEAQAQRAPAQSVVDRFASRYTPIVVSLAAAVAFVPPLLGEPFGTWFYRGLALLIISCPCALVISTPVSILAALSRAARGGVLIKGGIHLEQAAKVRAVAFDKTGTLTAGRPVVTDVIPLRQAADAAAVLSLAAAIERLSEHPLARAVVEAAASPSPEDSGCACGDHDEDGDAPAGAACCTAGDPPRAPRWRVDRFRAIAGKGVRAEIDGRLHFVGRPGLLGRHAADPRLREAVDNLERQGKTAIVLGDEQGVIGVVGISDPLRPGAPEAIRRLEGLGMKRITMLTGDNPATAQAIAAAAGIADVRAGLMPADKVAAADELRGLYGVVAMIGDGVNDAPALAAASLGVAMGVAGTDVALETADIVLMGDDLAAVPQTIRLARRTRRVVWENIVFSIAVKTLFLVLAPLGLATLWLAVFADMGTSLLVTANGLRLLRR